MPKTETSLLQGRLKDLGMHRKGKHTSASQQSAILNYFLKKKGEFLRFGFYLMFLSWLKQTGPIMPCSSPKHAPLHVLGTQLPGLNVWSANKNSFKGVLGSGGKKGEESSNGRKWTCSRTNSYFDPSVGSDWGSFMSICLAGISLAPGNPTGFLRIGEDSKVVRLELWRDTHSSTTSEEGGGGGGGDTHTWWLWLLECLCVFGCVLSSRVC